VALVVAQAMNSNVFCVYLCLCLSVWLYVSLFLRVVEYWNCSFFFFFLFSWFCECGWRRNEWDPWKSICSV
jgi:hypothetical protein